MLAVPAMTEGVMTSWLTVLPSHNDNTGVIKLIIATLVAGSRLSTKKYQENPNTVAIAPK